MRMNGYVLTMIANMSLDGYFRQHIARPIGMPDSSWQWTKKCGGSSKDYSNSDEADVRDAAGGMAITARQMARYGHLFLNRGNWNGTQVVSAAWVDAATSVQVPASMPYRSDTSRQKSLGSRGVGRYGYNWWVNGVGKSGTLLWPDVPEGAYYADGYNNNKCIVIPAWNMVIVRMGTSGNASTSTYNTFLKMVGAAIITDTAPAAPGA